MSTTRLAPSRTPSRAWSTPQSAADRQLVVLIHNGGIDLGIPELVDKLIAAIPGASTVVSDDMRARLISLIRDKLREVTDTLIESADLALNEFGAAKPSLYGEVTVLRDSTATFAELRTTLFDATRAGRVIDLLILSHGGSGRYIDAAGRVGADSIRQLRAEFGGPLSIRSVYMMNCVGSSLNGPWLDAGARTSVGTHDNNYLPEPTTHFFWTKWKDGQSFETAAMSAYRDTIAAMNALVRGVIVSFGMPFSLLASQVDFAEWDFVRDSRPEVVGAGTLTISTDTLPAPVSGTHSLLVTTVLPTRAPTRGVSRALSAGRAVSAAGRAFVTRWERPLLPPGDEGDAELTRRIASAEDFLSLKVAHPLAQHQIDALVSFACGIGARAFSRSRVLTMLTDGDTAGVPAEISRWTRVRTAGGTAESPALAERRRAEAELFSGTTALAVPASREVREYAFQQNPLAALTAAEAIQVGLAAAAIVQTQVNAFPGGTLNVSYDKQQRLLTPEARLQMPGAHRPKSTYTRDLLRLPQVRAGTAYAQLTIAWEGNDYGEISTPIVSRDLDRTSDFSRSDASIAISAVSRIPTGTDPRTWPLCYHYEGRYDPVGNGDWTFLGDFEVNAFGGIRFTNQRVADRSLLGDSWGHDSFRGPDVTAAVPTIPDDQMAYLRGHVPN
ncbi:lysozyme [Microbacterium sp. 2FI]|uniref:glycoside hydrolase family protein n=1 Tax=Microbacterium sp. 2FI TaxID=2502193 RepID=UPI0010F9BA99|nr:lysozyme [Microbacterium sp. 2FI]